MNWKTCWNLNDFLRNATQDYDENRTQEFYNRKLKLLSILVKIKKNTAVLLHGLNLLSLRENSKFPIVQI